MGTPLTPIIRPIHKIGLRGIRYKIIAVDALNAVYQFLALIRLPDGELFRDKKGRITSHLIGISTRYTRLMYEYGCKFIFVFDGPPHPLKQRELERRKIQRKKSLEEWRKALREGDLAKAFSKAVVSAHVDNYIVESAKKLLELMGIPVITAPHDAEAQAAFIVNRGDAWAANTLDWDYLLYGGARMVRYITLTGFEWLPSRGIARRLSPELIVLDEVLQSLDINRRQLIHVAILVGTDYNEGIKGIGPRRALKLIRIYGGIERLPRDIRDKLPSYWGEVEELFLHPPVNNDYKIEFREPDAEGLYKFLVDEHDFSPRRVKLIVERLEKASRLWRSQRDLTGFFGDVHDEV